MKLFKTIDKTFQFVGKVIVHVLGWLLAIAICLGLFLFATEWIWPEYNGSYSLGNNIYMIEWNGGGRVIVLGSNMYGKTCYGGSQLIPTYENQYDSLGHFDEYVIDAKADDSLIIIKTNNHINNKQNYYILDKRYNPNKLSAQDIINTKIKAFTDSLEFADACSRNRIDIKW